jgi:hypothetical protein
VYLYTEGRVRLVRALIVLLLFLFIGSSLTFATKSLGLLGLGLVSSLIAFDVIMAVYAALKAFTKIPALMANARMEAAKKKKSKS